MKSILLIVTFATTFGLFAQSPGGVSGNLQLWLKANGGTSSTVNGADVHTWTDQSPNAYSASDANTSSAPNYVSNAINFNPGLDFNGTSDGYDLGSNYLYSTNAGVHIYVVTKPDASASKVAQFVFDFGQYGNYGYALIASDDNIAGYISTSDGGVYTNKAITETQIPMLTSVTFDFGTSLTLFRNGISIGSGAITTASLTAANINENPTHVGATGPVSIGIQSKADNVGLDNGRYLDGTMAELIMFNDDISATSKNKVESYLAIKYGITLGTTASSLSYVASDATTVWTASATYQNDIAGIGRDDASALNQKQSKSGESDAIITMGLGSIATDNASNSNTFAVDKSFMLWGNNNGSLSESSAELPSLITKRLTREWKVQETGTVGTVDINVNAQGLSVSGTHKSDFYLLIDRDGDGNFTTGTVIRHAAYAYDGHTISFQNVDFQNGDIFTIATSVTQVTGLTHAPPLWLMADQGTSTTINGAAVSSWTGISPIKTLAQQATASKQPLFVSNNINFNPALSFDGSNDGLIADYNAGVSADSITLFTVFTKTATTGTHQTPFTARFENVASNTTMGYNVYVNNANGLSFWTAEYANNTWSTLNGNTQTLSVPILASFSAIVGDGTAKKTIREYGLQTANTTTAKYRIQDTAFETHIGYGISTGITPNYYLKGTINELIDFNYVLSNTEKQKMESYLAIKYGITLGSTGSIVDYLSSDGTVRWNGSATYQIDVAGIGRDDALGLNQKQSKSINATPIITMALGAVAATNATNANSFSVDKSFVIWGRDNQALSASGITDLPATVQARLARTWRVQESGTVGTVHVQFDASTLPGASGAGTNDLSSIRLLVDGDGVFSNATIVDKTAYNNTTDIVEFDYDFPIGTSYVTLGSVNASSAPLPIELVSFTVNSDDDNAILHWKTVSERNNDYFEIQHSSDGFVWTAIGAVAGHGSTLITQNYSYINRTLTPGTHYYRLRQVDYDGSAHYSDVRTVYTRPYYLLAYPNPTTGQVVVQLNADEHVLLYNTSGADVSLQVAVQQLSDKEQLLDLSLLPAGLYQLVSTEFMLLIQKI